MTQDTDDRLKKDFDVVGQRDARRAKDRAAENREVTEDRQLTEDDRLEMFRQQLFNDALPDLPDTPGYHMCWLTTTNPRDTIYRRMQLGYEPVKPEDVPGMEHASLKTGEYAGMIAVNEMLAFKLPMPLYQRFMQEAHHDAPLREEDKLAEVAEMLRAQAERDGASTTIYEGDGLSELREYAPRRGVFS